MHFTVIFHANYAISNAEKRPHFKRKCKLKDNIEKKPESHHNEILRYSRLVSRDSDTWACFAGDQT